MIERASVLECGSPLPLLPRQPQDPANKGNTEQAAPSTVYQSAATSNSSATEIRSVLNR